MKYVPKSKVESFIIDCKRSWKLPHEPLITPINVEKRGTIQKIFF